MNARRTRCRALFILILTTFFGVAASARATAPLVALAGSGSASPSAIELLNRVRGELVADGFRVVRLDPATGEDRVEVLTRAGQAAGAAIIAGVFVDDDEGVDLCLLDTRTSRVTVQRIERRAGPLDQAREVLARRSVDLLRASLLDFVVDRGKSPVAQPAVPVPELPPPALPPPAARLRDAPMNRVAIEGGLGVLGSFGGVGPAALPVVRVRLALNEKVQLRVTGAGLGTQPRVTAPSGVARIDQGVAFVDAALCLPKPRWIRPAASLGAGVYYVGVSGDAVAPLQGMRSKALAAAIAGGLGFTVSLSTHVQAIVEAQVIVAVPGLAVRFVDDDVARLGRPSVLGTLTLAGWL